VLKTIQSAELNMIQLKQHKTSNPDRK